MDLINVILAPQNIGKVILHVVLVQIGAALFGGGYIGSHIGFCANRALEGNLNLLAVVFKNLVSIPITMQNFKNCSQSARFSQIASPMPNLKSLASSLRTCKRICS